MLASFLGTVSPGTPHDQQVVSVDIDGNRFLKHSVVLAVSAAHPRTKWPSLLNFSQSYDVTHDGPLPLPNQRPPMARVTAIRKPSCSCVTVTVMTALHSYAAFSFHSVPVGAIPLDVHDCKKPVVRSRGPVLQPGERGVSSLGRRRVRRSWDTRRSPWHRTPLFLSPGSISCPAHPKDSNKCAV